MDNEFQKRWERIQQALAAELSGEAKPRVSSGRTEGNDQATLPFNRRSLNLLGCRRGTNPWRRPEVFIRQI